MLLALALLAGLAWWQRDRIGDTIDDLRGESTSAAVEAAPSSPADTPQAPGTGEPADPTETYLAWERANYEVLEPLLLDWQATISRTATTPDEVLAGAVQLREQTQLLANLVDTAPASQIRSDILSLLLNLMAAAESLERAVRDRDSAAASAAEASADTVLADLARFQAVHGTGSVFLR